MRASARLLRELGYRTEGFVRRLREASMSTGLDVIKYHQIELVTERRPWRHLRGDVGFSSSCPNGVMEAVVISSAQVQFRELDVWANALQPKG